MYKSLNGLAPDYLSNKFNYISSTHGVNTRQAAAGQLALPPWSNGNDIECFKSSFMYSGVKLWNDLDNEIRHSVNVQTLETSLICIFLLASRDVHFDKRMICFLSDLL